MSLWRVRRAPRPRDWSDAEAHTLVGVLIVLLAVIALVSLAFVALVGCDSPPDQGYVVRKPYSAPFSYWTSVCMSQDKNGWCTMAVPVQNHEPAHWKLCLRDEQNGKVREGCMEVDRETYGHYAVGQHYPDPQ